MAAQNSVLTQIARPYASALFDLASSENQLASVETSLSDVSRLIGESADFSRFLRSPVISADNKASALDALLGKAKTNPLVGNFLRLVAQNGRLFALDAIIAGFRELAAQARGEVTADVTSSAPLNADQVAALGETLKAKIGKTVTLNQFVDPSLIGGLQVKVGSQMIDSSLKTKLAAMKIAMKEVG
ncbi:F0F1 ATP synthase subunit delta [Devosia sp. J2-20]|uniref:ATP synthase subunit delta n=1 Tax=Devosia litorisediminis TaxID=2829817 RepID=A0A942I7J8_9HYPH|nr:MULTISPECIES: F0F1 ATP synthase subunit delta [Devosia]MBS3850238.1 F0F1 ATP synthase subunit delta [Devosia litorisediminis]MCZ4347272.1 F0F1 ATP synthase subunit delta [Devosia neptuniae]WDQ99995.1 F0F1 ATP synthase subunit delta [Devosia sp. J2-20]